MKKVDTFTTTGELRVFISQVWQKILKLWKYEVYLEKLVNADGEID